MTKAALNTSNMRLFEHAAALAAHYAWTDGYADPADTSYMFHAIYEKARARHDEATGIDPFVAFFNSLRLFADSARALDEFKAPEGLHLRTDAFRTYRDFLEMVWYGHELSPSFAGIHVGPVSHKTSSELILRQMLLSGALLLGHDILPSTLLPKFVRRRMRSLDGFRHPNADFRESKVDRIRATEAHLPKSNWDGAEIYGVNFRRAVLDGATFLDGAVIEDVKFNRASMRKAKFGTAAGQRSAAPQPAPCTDSAEKRLARNSPAHGVQVFDVGDFLRTTDKIPRGDADGHDTDAELQFAPTDFAMRILKDEVVTEAGKPDSEGTAATTEVDMATLLAETIKEAASVVPKDSSDTVHDAGPPPVVEKIREVGPTYDRATGVQRRFPWTRLRNVSFKDAIAPEIEFIGALLEKVSFFSTQLQRAKFDGATLTDIDFRYADLTGASFKGTIFRKRVQFSAHTKITLEQLMGAEDAGIAIAEWHRVFSGPGGIDRRSPPSGGTRPPSSGRTTHLSIVGVATSSTMPPQQGGPVTTAMPFGTLPIPQVAVPFGLVNGTFTLTMFSTPAVAGLM